MDGEVDRLARRLCADPRIATGTLRRMLKDIDDEIRAVLASGEHLPRAISSVREVVARACLLRREIERNPAGETPSSHS